MSFAIRGLGTAVPPDAVTPADGLGLARVLAGPDVRTSTWLGPVYANSGVNRRHQVIGGRIVRDVLHGTTHSGSPFLPTAANEGVGPTTGERMRVYAADAPRLAMAAAAKAVAESGFAADSLTHLVTVSCTGFVAPGIDYALIRELGLRPTVARTHVGFMGCHGALNGLRVARAFAAADPAARVLVCAVELCSLHYYYGNAPDKLVANAIFADGAAAVVGSGDRDTGWQLTASGSCLIPDSAADMGWTVGDHGFEMALGRRVPGLIARHVKPWLEAWLGDNGMSLAAVGSWAVHPGGPKILAAVEEGLALPPAALAASRAVYAEYGNMSSPTVLFVLDRLRREHAPRPCVALGFGPGLVAEAALFA
ncbi:MAG: type III polyketide synthase [Gemmataceae bacterium]|nr:type III polyketide synthase [Gemmataceae bacterium]